jgi:hypothetical protein
MSCPYPGVAGRVRHDFGCCGTTFCAVGVPTSRIHTTRESCRTTCESYCMTPGPAARRTSPSKWSDESCGTTLSRGDTTFESCDSTLAG